MSIETQTGTVVALWQGQTVAGDREAAFDQIARVAGAAGRAGAEVVVFPELFLTGYQREDLGELAMSVEEMAERIAPLTRAASCAICVGYPERAQEGLYNSALCMSSAGALLGNHRKIQLYGAAEAERFLRGSRYTIFDLGGKRAAILICYDVEFAPHIAALRARGVDLILAPTAAMYPFEHVGENVVPAMAANHGLAIVYSNLCGTEADLEYFGLSVIVGPDGKTLARAGAEPAMLLAALKPQYDAALLSTQARDFRPIEEDR
ncbi:MAG: nitrilase [Rhodobacteraceae bacterium]|nr:MAG: nitrilase [Paracoccaceae bacterium]